MSSPEPELGATREGNTVESAEAAAGEGAGDRYDMTGPEGGGGGDGQPEVVNQPSGGLMDIFGEDSELSDVTDSENEGDKEDEGRRSRSPSREATRSEHSATPAAAESGDGDGEGDEYTGDRDERIKKLSKIAKKKRAERDPDDDGEDQYRNRKKKTKKSRAREVEQDADPEEDPETKRRRELRARIDAAAKQTTNKRGKKKKAQDEEDIEMMNDEAVANLRSRMILAAERDVEDNQDGKPAVHKLRMLPQVIELMQKTALAETIVENGLLEAVKRWLEPLKDKSLPALNIQRPLFNILRTLTIETSALKSSELGKVVYFYTKCKRVDPAIARLANQLVSDWMRPILRRSKAFVDREVEQGGSSRHARFGSSSFEAAQKAAQAKQVEGGAAAGGQRRARIPEAMTATFTVAPRSNVGSGQVPNSGGGAASQARMREYKKKIQAGQQAARRV
ncbi:transcription factor SPN1 [Sporobolomyces salmoneus]|uniref:transcription factor SPN1 n=1 Tax=Sporobolomyces salmoneus TaxID=183962 RepID=UPI0031781A6D